MCTQVIKKVLIFISQWTCQLVSATLPPVWIYDTGNKDKGRKTCCLYQTTFLFCTEQINLVSFINMQEMHELCTSL